MATMIRSMRLLSRRIRPSIESVRHSTTSSKPIPIKARVLEQPDKFRPPSHASKRTARKNTYPGPPLSDNEKTAQKSKQYPHMMPPSGTFMHWFLTSRLLHTWISLSVLFSLASFVVLNNFLATTPFREDLPPNSLFSSHPITFISRYWNVYQRHTAHLSAETAERRRQNVEDVRKRAEYRKAHGLERESGFGGWTARADEDVKGSGMRGDGLGTSVPLPPQISTIPQDILAPSSVPDPTTTRPKKWFGIW